LGLVLLVKAVMNRRGWGYGLVLCLLILSMGSLTKVMGTFMLDAPLMLGLILAFVYGLELIEGKSSWTAWWGWTLGIALATASKGVVGFGIFGALILMSSLRGRDFPSFRMFWVGGLAAAAPFLIWYLALVE